MGQPDNEKRRTAAFAKLARALEAVGFPHGMSQVYTALMLAPGEGLSSSELASALHISRASVSNATQLLAGTELVERYRVPGSRETHYRILKGSWGPILSKKFSAMFAITRTAEQAMEFTDSELALERLEEMKDVYGFFEEEFVGIMKRWDEREQS